MHVCVLNATLNQVLKNKSEHAMVRHEAAEALGSIEHESVLPSIRTTHTSK